MTGSGIKTPGKFTPTLSVEVNAARRFQNPRSGWKHKAWGGAERNPRTTIVKNPKRAERAIEQTLAIYLS
ncbi:MAG: hypothetical protein QOF62_15 [Pyrinomonadaceae bacterium]|jgi:hypothetical protein|nr:hypothetical protein [Pyrinomonadaceae bacterium]